MPDRLQLDNTGQLKVVVSAASCSHKPITAAEFHGLLRVAFSKFEPQEQDAMEAFLADQINILFGVK